VLWHGTAASLVDLNPTGFSNTYAYGISGNNQVGFGYGDVTGGPSHALLWHGTAASFVDLHPASFIGSLAFGVSNDNIVGEGQATDGKTNALLWQGVDHSVMNLHPTAFPISRANDVSQDSQVGSGSFNFMSNGERHALLWHGTAASVVDLQPTGFTQTEAYGVAGAIQVGYGKGTATGQQQHALLWQGTAASVFDLHSLLTGLGHTFTSSGANDIDASGVIVGYAADSTTDYAVKWTPIVTGDYNGNGIVDAADFVEWRKGLGTTYTQNDYTVWRANFGRTAGSGAGAGAAPVSAVVPEPSSVVGLLVCAVVGIEFYARGTRATAIGAFSATGLPSVWHPPLTPPRATTSHARLASPGRLRISTL